MEINYPKAILRLRAKLNISQKELGKMLDVSFTTVNRWENGHFEPTKIIKVKLDELFMKNDIEVTK